MRPFPIQAATRAAPQPAPGEAKRLVILGATGSIDRSCARVIGESAGRFGVAAVAAGRNGRIGLGVIPRLVGRTLAAMGAAGEVAAPTTVAEATAIHHIARDRAAALLA
jgi:1-deoxy-D-xylulose-5-phosphate reductoisomerase